ncbi:MAG: hypothetical protein BGO78_09410 [Chloroflexi bacterium 44-23]|nr:MAG: hypothetical protein BGO78_09410 [Chloroflexi bacterium 44-23]
MTRISKFNSIQSRLQFFFLTILFLFAILILVIIVAIDHQKQDARVINLVSRQRVLLQQITSLAIEYDQAKLDRYGSAVNESVAMFDQTLSVLQYGGKIDDIAGNELVVSRPVNQNLQLGVDTLAQDWEIYRGHVNLLLDPNASIPPAAVVAEIQQQSFTVTRQADLVIQQLESYSNEQKNRFQRIQMVISGTGMILIIAGWWITRKTVFLPFTQLNQYDEGIDAGDLNNPIVLQGSQEFKELGQTMEAMRTQVLTSREELQVWASNLENRVQQRTRELEAMAAVSREISSHLSIGEVLNSVTNKARELTGSEVASLCLLDAHGKVLSLHAASGPEIAIKKNQSVAEEPMIGPLLREGCSYPCRIHSGTGFCMIIDPIYRVSHLAAPIYTGDKVIGALCVGSSQENAFQLEMSLVLRQLCDSAAVALENSRMYQQAELAATLEERSRVSSEMHDGLLQTLSFLGLMVKWAKDHIAAGDLEKTLSTLQQIERAEEQAEREIRRAISSLQDNFPGNYTLQENLSDLADDLSKIEPPILYETKKIIPLVLTRQENEQVLRVVREALINAQRHSQSKVVYLSMEEEKKDIVITVRDEGVGFDCGIEPQDDRSHFGIKIMKARALRLGGELTIQSTVQAGTKVQLRWRPISVRQYSVEE